MFRLVHDAVARLLGRPRSNCPEANDWDLARGVRTPDPYVWRLPSPHEARWRRWSRRSRATGRYPLFPTGEACWQDPSPQPPSPSNAYADPVRLYVLCSSTEALREPTLSQRR